MKPWLEESGVTLYHGNALEVLRQMPDESVNCCISSPPYWGLRSYNVPDQVWGGDPTHQHVWGEPIIVNATNHTDKRRWNHTRNGRGEEQPTEKQVAWLRTDVEQGTFCECGAWRGSLGLEPTPYLFVEHIVIIFEEVRRVLKSDGTAWVNFGDSYCAHPGQRKETDAAGPKQRTNEGAQGAPSRSADGLKPKDLVGVPWRVAFALQEAGWWLRSDIIWAKPAPMPESVTDRPTRSHEYIFLLAKSEKYYYDAEAIKEPSVANHPSGNGYKRDARLSYSDQNGARGSDEPWKTRSGKIEEDVAQARLIEGNHDSQFSDLYKPPCGKHSTQDKQASGRRITEGVAKARAAGGNHDSPFGDLRNKRDVWTVNTDPFPEAHFATFPPALIRPCVLAGCPEGGTILDPFSGAATTALVAKENGRKCIGIELNEEYLQISKRRLSQEVLAF